MVARKYSIGVGGGWGKGAGLVRKLCIDMYMLLYLKWIANKALWYSRQNSAQSYEAAWMGGVLGGMDTCICMAKSLCCAPETITRLWISYFCCLVTKSRLTLCDPMDCSPPGSSVRGISQVRILEWVAISFSRGRGSS